MRKNTIKSAELEKLTGLTDQRHRQLAKAGHFPAPKDGRYEFEPTIKGIIAYYKQRQDGEELKAQKLRKVTAEADRIEDDISINRLKYVEKREVYKFFEIFLIRFRAHVLSSPLDRDVKDLILEETGRIMDGSLEEYIRDAREHKGKAIVDNSRIDGNDETQI
jgi:hypothetical protein